MAQLRIFRPTKNAMQSGRRLDGVWRVEFAPGAAKEIDPLMGWAGSGDTRNQITMTFDSKDEAIAYAQRSGLAYVLQEPTERKVRPRAYADNFRHDRIR